MKFRTLIFVFVLLSLISTACNASQNEGWQTYKNDELGVSFEFPATWAAQAADGVVNIAITQEILDSEIGNGAGASITLASTKDFDGATAPQDILILFMDYFEYGRGTELEKINGPEVITLQGQSAGRASYRGTVRDQVGLYTVTVITNGDHVALVLTIDGSPDEGYQEVLHQVTQSVLVYPPKK